MVKQFHDTPPRPIRPQGIRNVKDGCYEKGIGVDLVKKSDNYSSDSFHVQPTTPWPNNAKEQLYFDKICELQSKVNKFPWEGIGIGFAVGSLFWGIMFGLFGGGM